jgi:hypothetical protein
MLTNDSDTQIRDLINSGDPFSNLKVTPSDLEEAIAIYRQNQTISEGETK